VKPNRSLSPQARLVLAALLQARETWSHGYELARLANVKSGTLYPLLIRLEEQGYLEAEWQQPQASGRPPRHAYRLTSSGISLAQANPPEQAVAPLQQHRVRAT
jgi:PadR family transcriptional regulator, regulatory protein PadR